ncbi:MAG TPA: hypothetical protein VK824_07840, partial [Planctomycetota bacterium]|nr:hypothetical protein [Planctomycetota bacterium]
MSTTPSSLAHRPRSVLHRAAGHGLRALSLGALLAPLAGAQFNLYAWHFDDPTGTGAGVVTPDFLVVSPSDFTPGGGSIMALKTVAPSDGRISVDMAYMTFDGFCNASVPVFLHDGQATVLATCTTFETLSFGVKAGKEFGFGIKTNIATWPASLDFTHFHFETLPPFEPFADLGNGLPGTSGVPALSITSLLYGHFPFTLTLDGAAPSLPVALVVGLSAANVPFKGGVLVPAPDVILTGLGSDAAGKLTVTTFWPSGIPSGTQLYLQGW